MGYKSAAAIIFFIVILFFFGHSSGIQVGKRGKNHAHKTSNILDFIFVSEALRCSHFVERSVVRYTRYSFALYVENLLDICTYFNKEEEEKMKKKKRRRSTISSSLLLILQCFFSSSFFSSSSSLKLIL